MNTKKKDFLLNFPIQLKDSTTIQIFKIFDIVHIYKQTEIQGVQILWEWSQSPIF